jgi:DGQHR domain-containing protein
MSKLKPELRSQFDSKTLKLLCDIGSSARDLKEKVTEVMEQLGDPLLSSEDIVQLLGLKCPIEESEKALSELEANGVIESDTATSRPLEEEGTKLYRLSNVSFRRLKVFAHEYDLGDGKGVRYQFACNGRLLRSIARIDRLDSLASEGNQREEIRKHVAEIKTGLESGTQVPNSVILVFKDEMVTDVDRTEQEADYPNSHILITKLDEGQEYVTVEHKITTDSDPIIVQKLRVVEISFPFRLAAFDSEKPVLLVDGQQRTAALNLADIEKCPMVVISVNAIRASDDEAKDVFHIANSTVKINADFKRALLASMGAAPGYLKSERNQAIATKILALEDAGSPFFQKVMYQGVKYPKGSKPPVAYNSLFSVVRMFAEGSLKDFLKEPSTIAEVVKRTYSIIKNTWPEEWGVGPTKSRLMHGAGMRSTGHLILKKIGDKLPEYKGDILDKSMWAIVAESIDRLKDHLIWSDLAFLKAPKLARKFYKDNIDGVQNTPTDIQKLTEEIVGLSIQVDLNAKTPNKG